MAKQVLENLELLHGQLDRLPGADHLARHEIHFEILVLQFEYLIGPPAAEECADACEELRDRERLHQVVVSSTIEPAHAIADGVPGRKDQDRRLKPTFADRRQDLEPIPVGKHEIQDYAVECLVVDEEETFFA